jgi:hypothetical protein
VGTENGKDLLKCRIFRDRGCLAGIYRLIRVISKLVYSPNAQSYGNSGYNDDAYDTGNQCTIPVSPIDQCVTLI